MTARRQRCPAWVENVPPAALARARGVLEHLRRAQQRLHGARRVHLAPRLVDLRAARALHFFEQRLVLPVLGLSRNWRIGELNQANASNAGMKVQSNGCGSAVRAFSLCILLLGSYR